jgi:hypothetical protein
MVVLVDLPHAARLPQERQWLVLQQGTGAAVEPVVEDVQPMVLCHDEQGDARDWILLPGRCIGRGQRQLLRGERPGLCLQRLGQHDFSEGAGALPGMPVGESLWDRLGHDRLRLLLRRNDGSSTADSFRALRSLPNGPGLAEGKAAGDLALPQLLQSGLLVVARSQRGSCRHQSSSAKVCTCSITAAGVRSRL